MSPKTVAKDVNLSTAEFTKKTVWQPGSAWSAPQTLDGWMVSRTGSYCQLGRRKERRGEKERKGAHNGEGKKRLLISRFIIQTLPLYRKISNKCKLMLEHGPRAVAYITIICSGLC